jgi:hypothetical protein
MQKVKHIFARSLKSLDNLLCNYIGLQEEVSNPILVKNSKGELTITYTETFKRHYKKSSWENFQMFELDKLPQEKKKKLGMAIGKSLAKKFIVSFEPAHGENS